MRLLILTPTYFKYPDMVGGAERYVSEITSALEKKSEITSILFVSFSESPCIYSKGKIKYIFYKRKLHKNNLSNPKFPWKLLLQTNFDLIYIHQFHTWLLPGAILMKWLHRKPLVLTDHNGGGPTYNRKCHLEKHVDLFLPASRLSHMEMDFQNVPHSPIFGGANLENFTTDKSVKNINQYLFVGRAHPIKGLDHIIDSLKDVTKKVHLVFALSISKDHIIYYQDLKSKIHTINKRGVHTIEILENADIKKVIKLYQESLITILPSIDQRPHESLGLTVFESLACGTPVAISKFCGVAELAKAYPTDAIQIIDNWVEFFNSQIRIESSPRKWVLDHGDWSCVADRFIKAVKEI